MVFVQRTDGKITGIYANAQPGYAEEELADDNSEVLAYLNPPAPTPSTVTPAQAKIALFNAGLFDQVEALVAGYPYKPVELWWTSANSFERGNAYLQALAVEMELSDSQVDDLFVAAAKL